MNWIDLSGCWHIAETSLPDLHATLLRLLPQGKPLQYWDDDEIRERPKYQLVNGVAVIPITGVILKRESWITRYGYGTSTDALQVALQAALDDVSVRSIVLDVDSPGGTSSGTPDAADAIYAARGQKPLVSIANDCCCSAGIFLGSAAEKLYVTQTSQIGSIGTKVIRLDATKAYEQMGLQFTVFQTGAEKSYGDPAMPITDAERARWSELIANVQQQFIETIARNRGLTADEVVNRFGSARVFWGQEAVTAGLADGVTTLGRLIAELSGQPAEKGLNDAGTDSSPGDSDPCSPHPDCQRSDPHAGPGARRRPGIRISGG